MFVATFTFNMVGDDEIENNLSLETSREMTNRSGGRRLVFIPLYEF